MVVIAKTFNEFKHIHKYSYSCTRMVKENEFESADTDGASRLENSADPKYVWKGVAKSQLW